MSIMNESGDIGVYVVDEDFRIQYFNEVMAGLYPGLTCGGYCYQELCDEISICSNCAVVHEEKRGNMYYNQVHGIWVEVNCTKVDWPGAGPCTMVIARMSPDQAKDLFCDMSHLAMMEQPDTVREHKLDSLTGLYWNISFFREAKCLLDRVRAEDYCLLALDIEHFKLYNEWHGRGAGDEFLKHIAFYLKQMEELEDCVAGYMGGDDFAIVLPNNPECLKSLQDRVMEGAKRYGRNAGFLPAFGLYAIDDKDVPISQMYDRAMIAMSEVKGNYAQRSKWYDNRMIGQLEEDHILLSEVQRALEQAEFIYYLQPKCNMETGRIIGFESLVRWQHPSRGLISPGGFVPLLEKNGFITTLDFYVWEKMCADMRSWIDQGIKPVPISVNVSRIDIFVMDVVECFCNLVEKYNLDPRLVEIEITETSYSEEYQIIMGVVEQLRAAGFLVLMDDFGSGYSSLNMLKDVNVDVLKLDMKFLDMNEESLGRGVGILKAIVNMARFMGISLIAEGVETKAQMQFLLDMGCTSAQGYYFYKPLPVSECLEMLRNPDMLDYGGIRPLKVDQMRIRDLINDDVFSEMTINNILGGIAICSVNDDKVKLLRVNDQYCSIMKIDQEQLQEKDYTPLQQISQEDHQKFITLFHNAFANPFQGAEEVLQCIRGDGSSGWIRARVFFMRGQYDNQMYYASISDVTGQTIQEQKLAASEWALESILRQAGINSWDWDMAHDRLTMSHVNTQGHILAPGKDTKERTVIVEDFTAQIDSWDFAGPEERDGFARYLERLKNNHSGRALSHELALNKEPGMISWHKIVCETLLDENGHAVKAVGYYEDISRSIQSAKYQLDTLTGLLNHQTALSKIKNYLQERTDEPAILVLVTLNHFQVAKDTYGPLSGDRMLVRVAGLLSRSFRNNDIIGRSGSGEFVVLCKNIEGEVIQQKLQMLLAATKTICASELKSQIYSVSAGYARIPDDGTGYDELYRKADQALLHARSNQGSAFCQYDPSLPDTDGDPS